MRRKTNRIREDELVMKKMEKQSFAKSFAELEEIANWFEREDIDVEEGIQKFEEGMRLAKLCKERLEGIENEVTEIKKKFALNEEASEAPFEEENEVGQ